MINFFRNIRRQLANDNKFQKYFRYAFGEVILVVVGILIALSINNWNDVRKDRIKEKEILLTFKNDFRTNIGILKSDVDNLQYNVNSCDTILEVIRLKKPISDSLPLYFHRIRVVFNSKLSFTAYESLKSTGFDIIENSTLRNEIIKLYEVTYTGMLENLNSYVDYSSSLVFSYYLTNFDAFGAKAIPNNYVKVINDTVYKNIVNAEKTLHSWGIMLKKPCIRESERLIQLIDNELGKM